MYKDLAQTRGRGAFRFLAKATSGRSPRAAAKRQILQSRSEIKKRRAAFFNDAAEAAGQS
jgi:hypothetical protein